MNVVRKEIIESWLQFYLDDNVYQFEREIGWLIMSYYKDDGYYGIITKAFIDHEDGIKFLNQKVNQFTKSFKITKKEVKELEKEWNINIKHIFMWRIIQRFKDRDFIFRLR